MKGTNSSNVGNITIKCMSQEARDLLNRLCEKFKEAHGKDVIKVDGYQALYWACRHSGLIEPSGEPTLNQMQEKLYAQYLTDEKDKIFEGHGDVGDIAELGLVAGEEVGEAMIGIRKKLGLGNLKEECGDILTRTLNFMSRKGIDAESALALVHVKNVERNRKGLFVEDEKRKP